jgi:peroxiredoxin/outer membrane lipoprotein-sorting protein
VPIPFLVAPALILAAPAFYDEKAVALLAEVAAKGKSLKSLSAEMTMLMTGPQPQKLTGKLLIKNPNQGRVELASEKAEKAEKGESVLVIADGKYAYSITGKKYTKEPVSPTSLWPFLTGVPGTDPKKFNHVGVEKIGEISFDVLEMKEGPRTLRLFVSPEKLIQRFVMSMTIEGKALGQELTLSHVQLDGEIATASLTLPAGLEEEKAPGSQGMDELSAKLIKVGKKAPAFNLATPAGPKLSLAKALVGKKAVLVNFWFVGCPPCRAEHPELQKLYVALKAKGLGMVGINQGDDSKSITSYLKSAKLTFPVVKAVPATLSAYGIQAFPTNYILDAKGNVVYSSVGFDEAGMKAALAKLGLK